MTIIPDLLKLILFTVNNPGGKSKYAQYNNLYMKNYKIRKILSIIFVVTVLFSGCTKASEKIDSDYIWQPDVSPAADKPAPSVPGNTSASVSPVATPTPLFSGITVVLDPGHGGIFSGAVFDERTEKYLTLTLAEYVRDCLLEACDGISVLLTRTGDTELDTDLAAELEKRAIFAADNEADFFVSLHFNASDSHDSHGATVYYSLRDNVTDTSHRLAESVLAQLTALGLKDCGTQIRKSNDLFDSEGKVYDYYAVLRHNANRDIPAVIVEHCFMDNAADIGFLCDEQALKTLAKADAEGIVQFLTSTLPQI